MVARRYRRIALAVTAALVITLPGPALVSHHPRAVAAEEDPASDPEESVPSNPLPPPATGPDPEAALNVDTSPDPVSTDPVPEGQDVVEVAEPTPTDPDVGGGGDGADIAAGTTPPAASTSGARVELAGAHAATGTTDPAVPVSVRELQPDEVPDTPPAEVVSPDGATGSEGSTGSGGTAAPAALRAGAVADPDPGIEQPSVPAGTDLQVISLGPDVVQQLGAQYLAFQVTRTDGDTAGAAWVQADIDASSFATTAGANYLSRLRVVAYPACVLTTPQDPVCSTATPLPSTANPDAQTVSAAVPVSPTDVQVSGAVARSKAVAQDAVYRSGSAGTELVTGGSGGVVMAVASGPSGPGGDYRATDLSPTGSWVSGGQSGSFTYSYPIPVPPSVGGAAPQLAFNYDSGSVDGRTSSQNSQASWAGLGWDVSTGFIERKYKSCSDDGHTTWNDLCWDSPYSDKSQGAMVMSLGGKTTELIWVSGNTWRAADDDGWVITHMTGADNGEDGAAGDTGEWWKVQVKDGTTYYFGYGHLAGSTTVATNSVATVPVFPGSGEPTCTARTDGWCHQGWRWMLDRVTDVRENIQTYYYTKETNRYAVHGDTSRSYDYDSAIYPIEIDYGQQYSEATTQTPPAKVFFGHRNRCVENTAETDPLNNGVPSCPSLTMAHAASYPDVPVDLVCTGTCSSDQSSPTFFQVDRLDYVSSQVKTSTGSYVNAFRVQPRYYFPAVSDGSSPSLWLDYIQTRGYLGAGSTAYTTPDTNFNGIQLANRVDYKPSAGVKPMKMFRVNAIRNDLGGLIRVTYGNTDRDCPFQGDTDAAFTSWFNSINGNWDHNTWNCYNVWHDPDSLGPIPPGFGIFHKYLATKVELVDDQGGQFGSPTETYSYDYQGNPSWTYADDILYSRGSGNQTWDQWRGYPTVSVTHGTGSVVTRTDTKYFRGLEGDWNADGTTKSSSMADYDGNSQTDYNYLAGKPVSERIYDATTGGNELKSTEYHYWKITTANGPVLHNANIVRADDLNSRDRYLVTSQWRNYETVLTFDSYGSPRITWDKGNTSTLVVPNDDTCTDTQYAQRDDGTFYIVSLPKRVITTYGTPNSGNTTCPGVVTSKVETLYDGATSPDTVTGLSDGEPTGIWVYQDPAGTKVEKSVAAFDVYGRQTLAIAPQQVADGGTATRTWLYTPSSANYPTTVKMTNPLGQDTTTYPSRWHNAPDRIIDLNGNNTFIDYDALGRTTNLWLPTETSGAGTGATKGTASMIFTYPPSAASPVPLNYPARVSSSQLQTGTSYQATYTYLDGFGRTREVQQPSPSGTGRMVVSTAYTTQGLPQDVSAPIYNSSNAGTGMLSPDWTVTGSGCIPSEVRTSYEELGRAVASQQYGCGVLKWQTTTVYNGGDTTVTPPVGAKTATYLDAHDRVTKIDSYEDATVKDTTTYAYTFPTGGPLTTIKDPNNDTTSIQSDLAGHMVASTDPNAGVTSTVYDLNGNVMSSSNPGSGTVATLYDVLNRPYSRTMTAPGGGSAGGATWTYDNTTSVPNGIGQLDTTTSTTIAAGTSLTVTDQVLSYDKAYRALSTKTTLPTSASLLGSLSGVSYTSSSAYDNAGHAVSATLPAIGGLGLETVQTGYSTPYGVPNTLGIGTAGAANIISGTTWTGSGLLNTRTYASTAGSPVTRAVVWDPVRRAPSEVQAYYGATPTYLQRDVFERDSVGNVSAIVDRSSASGLANGQAQCFLYDGRNRLTDAWTAAATASASGCPATPPADSSTSWNTGVSPYRSAWRSLPNGNLSWAATWAISGSTATKTQRAYTYDTINNHPAAVASITPSTAGTANSDGFGYDAAGRQNTRSVNGATTTTLAWNPASDMTSSVKGSATTRYVYDASGQRALKITPTNVTAYLGADEVSAPLPSGAAVGTRYYTEAGTLVATRVGSGALVFQLADIQGSANLQVGSGDPASAVVKRQRYSPYGGPRGAANQLDIERGWLGQTQDDATNETGLTYLNARYYDPAASRFISVDPLIAPGIPATLNPYTYSQANPEALSDPSGLIGLGTDGEPCGDRCWGSPGHRGDSGHGGPPPHNDPDPSRPLPNKLPGGVTPPWSPDAHRPGYVCARFCTEESAAFALGYACNADHPNDNTCTREALVGATILIPADAVAIGLLRAAGLGVDAMIDALRVRRAAAAINTEQPASRVAVGDAVAGTVERASQSAENTVNAADAADYIGRLTNQLRGPTPSSAEQSVHAFPGTLPGMGAPPLVGSQYSLESTAVALAVGLRILSKAIRG